jgi:hypothetical protein
MDCFSKEVFLMAIASLLLSLIPTILLSLLHPGLYFFGICVTGAFLVYAIARQKAISYPGLRAAGTFFLSAGLGVAFLFLGQILLTPVICLCTVGAFLISLFSQRPS